MSRLKVTFWKGSFAELRTLPAVMQVLNDKAEAIAEAAGRGYEAMHAEKTGGRVRGRAAVVPTTPAAVRDAAKNGTLQRAMNAGIGDV